jgi:hypothetical protein
MAATLTEEGRISLGGSRALAWGTVLMDNSYPTGGEAIDATGDLGYDAMVFESSTVVLQWDKANQKVVAYWGNAGSASVLPEVTATTDLSAVSAQFIAITAAA